MVVRNFMVFTTALLLVGYVFASPAIGTVCSGAVICSGEKSY
jgi:hypothetical protein